MTTQDDKRYNRATHWLLWDQRERSTDILGKSGSGFRWILWKKSTRGRSGTYFKRWRFQRAWHFWRICYVHCIEIEVECGRLEKARKSYVIRGLIILRETWKNSETFWAEEWPGEMAPGDHFCTSVGNEWESQSRTENREEDVRERWKKGNHK